MSPEDLKALRRDKYNNDPNADLSSDIARLEAGEPLAYVIGWVPFMGLTLNLDTLPLIPRPETEWWTELLIAHLNERYPEPFELLDLCAGSGAIGLAVLKHVPNARVTFGELVPAHCALIHRNAESNNLDQERIGVCTSDLFGSLPSGKKYDVIVSNPPYVPEHRTLPKSVSFYEPHGALRAGQDGLSLIRRMAADMPHHITEGGEVWIECDVSHAEEVGELLKKAGAREVSLHKDQYGRPRLSVSYW